MAKEVRSKVVVLTYSSTYSTYSSHSSMVYSSTSLTTLFTFFQNQITFKGDSVKKVIENSLKGDIKC